MLSPMVMCLGLICAVPADVSSPDEARRAYDKQAAATGNDATAQVKLALWCEANGLRAERAKHLGLAILSDPKHAAARGLMGLVEYGGRWVKAEAVADEFNDGAELAKALSEYRTKRESLKNSDDYHYVLGLWCEKAGLKAEAIAHFTNVVRAEPKRDAAWKHLGYKKRNGVWMSDAQYAATLAERDAQGQADRKWKPLLKKYKAYLADKVRARRDEAEARLAEIDDPRAVPAIWAVFATGTPASQEVAARTLGPIDGPAASRALALLAVLGGSPEVRAVATETLKRRDSREYVDYLIDLIRKPFRYEVRPLNGPGSTGEIYVEGERFNVRRLYNLPESNLLPVPGRFFAAGVPYNPAASQASLMMPPAGVLYNPAPGASKSDRTNQGIADLTFEALRRDAEIASTIEYNNRTIAADTALAEQRFANEIRTLETTNANIKQTNERSASVLKEVTDQDFGVDSVAWKKWQADQKGYVYVRPPETKPIRELTVSLYIGHSCFAAGTPVRTIEGLREIESIRVGDRVAVQDGKTGKIEYQPVVSIFHNPPSPTLRITLEGETVVATGIHRFWKAGKGWAMARDLKPGDAIRTLGGTSKVLSVGSDQTQPVFNLEVADGRSFFVGKSSLLVHDNSLVEATPDPFDAAPALAVSGE